MDRFIKDLTQIDEKYDLRPPVDDIWAEAQEILNHYPQIWHSYRSKRMTLPLIMYYRWAKTNTVEKIALKPLFRETGVSSKNYFSISQKITNSGYKWKQSYVPRVLIDSEVVLKDLVKISNDIKSPIVSYALKLIEKHPLDFGVTPHVMAAVSYAVAQKILGDENPLQLYKVGMKVGCSTSTIYKRYDRFFKIHPSFKGS